MTLVFTGETGSSEQFEKLLEAMDGETRVVVITSLEAIEDHGLDAVEQKAIDKYAAGKFDADGRLRVVTSDF